MQASESSTVVDIRLLQLARVLSVELPGCREEIYGCMFDARFTSIVAVKDSAVVGGCTFSCEGGTLML